MQNTLCLNLSLNHKMRHKDKKRKRLNGDKKTSSVTPSREVIIILIYFIKDYTIFVLNMYYI